MRFDTTAAEIRIFHKNLVNNVAADTMAPCVARSLAAMVLIKEDRCFPVLHSGGIIP